MNEQGKHIDIHVLTRFLAGESDQQEEAAVKDWIAKSEMNRSEFEEMEKVWNTLEKTGTNQRINLDNEWNYLQSRIMKSKIGSKQFSMIPLLRIAAVVILVFSLAFLSVRFLSQNKVTTQLAETVDISLPDGSKVTLNAGSQIRYKSNFGESNRVLKLRGEAYFDVERDTENPFIIELQNAEVKVLGTSFNVKAYKGMEKVEVTVAEGKVSVYNKKQPQNSIIAIAGEKAEYNKQKKVVRKTDNPDRNFNAWKTRTIIFENDSLQQIVSTLSNVYHKTIVLDDPELKNCTLTTIFENEDLGTIFQVLESTLDIKIKEEADKIYISGSGC